MLYEIINKHGSPYRPYMGGMVNHLPMAQLALFEMTGDLNRVEEYSDFYTKHFRIDPVRKTYDEISAMEDCIGNREEYEGCLDLVREEMKSTGAAVLVKNILKAYPLGMSSGIFHVLIRLGYAVKGWEAEPESTEEVARALAYYITGCRIAALFTRKVKPLEFRQELVNLNRSSTVETVVKSASSMGQKMKALYLSEEYLHTGMIIDGNEDEKILTLLSFLMPLFLRTHDIVELHCITGLHAALMLKEYFVSYKEALDILTTCITTHLLSSHIKEDPVPVVDKHLTDWPEIIKKGAASQDVHTIKLTYTCHELYKRFELEPLKAVALAKIG